MSWEEAVRAILFVSGMLTGGSSLYLFYNERFYAGTAFLIVAAVFLGYATRMRGIEKKPSREGFVDDAALAELALFVADLAVSELKGIGRTVLPTTKEVEQIENRLDVLLNHMGVPSASRSRLYEEFDKLRGRVRRSEGGRALARSVRL